MLTADLTRLRHRLRRWFTNSVILVLICGSLYSIISYRELWPFSCYPMFAYRANDPLVRTRLFGVPRDPDAAEVPMLKEFIAPIGEVDMVMFLRPLLRQEKHSPALKAALADCLRRYEKRRLAGTHSGPPLQGIRIYRLTWKLDPEARNVDSPDNKEILAELMIDAEVGR